MQPIKDDDNYIFTVKTGTPPPEAKNGTKLARGASFSCLISGTAIDSKYIYSQGRAKRLGSRLMAIVAEGTRGRVYLAPTPELEAIAAKAEPSWKPELLMPDNPRWFSPPLYGLSSYGDLFSSRQLVALTTFCDQVNEVREKIIQDARLTEWPEDMQTLNAGGTGAVAYAEAVSVYLAFVISSLSDRMSTICTWDSGGPTWGTKTRNTFARQAIPMTWSYAEVNPFSTQTGSFGNSLDYTVKSITVGGHSPGIAQQADAAHQAISFGRIVSTDPPYYDNIGYADLSDFFYIWLRYSLRKVFPDLFATLAAPKSEELVAAPYRHGGKEPAGQFFLDGMTQAMSHLARQSHPAFPSTIYYAFKQSESDDIDGTTSTGWETFLDAVIRAGFSLTGTWPLRTELGNRLISKGTNALASSIVLVCRKRPAASLTISRREFLRELNAILPEALDEMTKGSGDERSPVAPVDLSQAIIGPGMAVFSKYAAVLEADGSPMPVRTALQLINRFLAEDDFDPDTQFCLHWFEQHGWAEGRYGEADILSRAKGTSVDGVRDAGVVASGGGIVRLRRWPEYPTDWDPEADSRNPVWETLHHLIRALKQGGEFDAGRLLAAVPGKAEPTRQLAYRLYTLCERQGWAEDARAYNELITSWPGIEATANAGPTDRQAKLFD